jgi:hypothetical protein
MEIANSLEWANVETTLLDSISRIPNISHAMTARKMLSNLRPMVTKLSQMELEARRSSSHSPRRVNEQLEFFNRQLANYEQWLMICLLS